MSSGPNWSGPCLKRTETVGTGVSMSDPHFKYQHPTWTERMQASSGVNATTFFYIPIVEVLSRCRREALLYIKKKKGLENAATFRENSRPVCLG